MYKDVLHASELHHDHVPEDEKYKDTRALLRMVLQVLFTSRAGTGGDGPCIRFSSITRDHKRIMETFRILEAPFQRRIRQHFDIIKAKYTRTV